jgi:hypothetical protein
VVLTRSEEYALANLIELVHKYRGHYRSLFAKPSLNTVRGYAFQVPFDLDGRTHTISVTFEGACGTLPSIWATNLIHAAEDGQRSAIIVVSPEVQTLGAIRQKAILAHEYVEVVSAIVDGRQSKAVHTRQELVLFLALSKRRAIFSDTWDERDEIALAVRELLVSQESIRQVMDELGIAPERLRELVASNPAEAYEQLDVICRTLSASEAVDVELVEGQLISGFLVDRS